MTLEQSLDPPIFIDADRVRRRYAWQTRHSHDRTGHNNDKLGARRKTDLTNLNMVS